MNLARPSSAAGAHTTHRTCSHELTGELRMYPRVHIFLDCSGVCGGGGQQCRMNGATYLFVVTVKSLGTTETLSYSIPVPNSAGMLDWHVPALLIGRATHYLITKTRACGRTARIRWVVLCRFFVFRFFGGGRMILVNLQSYRFFTRVWATENTRSCTHDLIKRLL